MDTDRPTEPTRSLRAVFFVLGGTSVASLLAWVYGLSSFRDAFLFVSLPGQVLLVVGALVVARRTESAGLRTLLVAGAIGGLLGTFAYDLFRVPFVIAGFRVLAPIDSYGVLAAGTSASSPWTGLLGWAYHFANGVGFGIAYAMLAPRRNWRWGVAWALLLESATIVTPFATLYALRGTPSGVNWTAISIAYAAHIPFGWIVGRAVERPERIVEVLRAIGRHTVPVSFVVVIVALLGWQAPWSYDAPAGRNTPAGTPTAEIVDQRLHPQWLRVPVNGCAVLVNLDDEDYRVMIAGEPVVVTAGENEVCFPDAGVLRLRTTDEPYAGGFVIVDARP